MSLITKVLPLNMPIIANIPCNKKAHLSCPYFSGKYGAPTTRPPKCIDENDNGDCDIDEEKDDELIDYDDEVLPEDPNVSVHNNFTYLDILKVWKNMNLSGIYTCLFAT